MYQQKDFETNPAKYTMFSTAVVAKNVFTENGANDLPVGTHVAVKYHATVRNQLFRRDEPVYAIYKQGGEFWGHLYANALDNFVL
jgi:hypothetical protein